MKKTFFTLTILLLISIMGRAEAITIKGVVYEESKNPIPFVNIMVEGTSTGTVSDLEGKFKIINETDSAANARLAVALIDLDNFKSINTFCGHGAGDMALAAFAEREYSSGTIR